MKKYSIFPFLINLFSIGVFGSVLISAIDAHYLVRFALLLTLIYILAYLVHMRVVKPIKELTRIADLMASWDTKARMPTSQKWEIAQLAEFSNYMMDRMQNSIERHKQSRDEMQMILSSIEDALWVQDKAGKVELANSVFAKLFPLYEQEHKVYCWEIIREPELLRIIKDISEGDKPRMMEIKLGTSEYLLSASIASDADKAIFILQNIDNLKATEKIKKDFALNVAHELRTPLTAIKGFVDILADDAKPESLRYFSIIQNHTTRLIALVSDLENLAKLEQAPRLDLQDVSMKTFLKNIYSIYETTFQERGLSFAIEVEPDNLRTRMDPFRMEQVFINLIDNALRYTSEGGVRISVAKKGTQVRIIINDTGAGIDQVHLPRLFERFYTVDHSRSRNTGGTGLGLAIVKHIVQSHGGSVSVSSTVGSGTTFTIELP